MRGRKRTQCPGQHLIVLIVLFGYLQCLDLWRLPPLRADRFQTPSCNSIASLAVSTSKSQCKVIRRCHDFQVKVHNISGEGGQDRLSVTQHRCPSLHTGMTLLITLAFLHGLTCRQHHVEIVTSSSRMLLARTIFSINQRWLGSQLCKFAVVYQVWRKQNSQGNARHNHAHIASCLTCLWRVQQWHMTTVYRLGQWCLTQRQSSKEHWTHPMTQRIDSKGYLRKRMMSSWERIWWSDERLCLL